MALPDEFLRELHDRNDIESVVSTYVQLRPRGKTRVGLCPFHSESTPSFTVYPDTDSFYCFGCRVGGDAITFIKRMENLDYIDAVKLLAERSGLKMPEYDGANSANRELRLTILDANREAARFFNSTLSTPLGKEGLDYLKNSRALGDRTIRAFGLGFAPDRRGELYDHLVKMGFKPSDLVQANLVFQDRRGGYTDRFRNRVMFPIIDVRGNVIAFGGRIMTDEKPKYLNTSDTLAYKKTNNLYALNRAKNSKEDRFILCEGYMDVIALYQAGFDNVVGGLGTALTEEQAKLIRKYRQNVVLCYDSDEAGQKAALAAIKIFDKQGVNTYVLKVPDGKDPDEYLKRHGENGYIKFKALVDDAKSGVDYVFDMLRQKYNVQTVEGKMDALNEAAHFLSSLSNPVKRDLYAGKLSDEMGIKRDSLDAVIDADLRAQGRREQATRRRTLRQSLAADPETVGENVSKRSQKAEESLCALLMAHPDMIKSTSEKLRAEDFRSPFAGRLYSRIIDRSGSGRGAEMRDISGDFTDDENMQLARIMAQYNETDGAAATPNLCSEYINVILSEGKKQTARQLSEQSGEDIMRYFSEAKKNKKSKGGAS